MTNPKPEVNVAEGVGLWKVSLKGSVGQLGTIAEAIISALARGTSELSTEDLDCEVEIVEEIEHE